MSTTIDNIANTLAGIAFLVFPLMLGGLLYFVFWGGSPPAGFVLSLFIAGVLGGDRIGTFLFDLLPCPSVPAACLGFAYLAVTGLANIDQPFGSTKLALGTVGFSVMLQWTGMMLRIWFGGRSSATS